MLCWSLTFINVVAFKRAICNNLKSSKATKSGCGTWIRTGTWTWTWTWNFRTVWLVIFLWHQGLVEGVLWFWNVRFGYFVEVFYFVQIDWYGTVIEQRRVVGLDLWAWDLIWMGDRDNFSTWQIKLFPPAKVHPCCFALFKGVALCICHLGCHSNPWIPFVSCHKPWKQQMRICNSNKDMRHEWKQHCLTVCLKLAR